METNVTEVNHRRNGKRYGVRTPHYMRFWWAGKLGLYKNSGWAPDYKRACKRQIGKRRRRFLASAACLLYLDD